MKSGGFDTCALCPRLCRPACPVTSGGGREAAVPAALAGVLLDWSRGKVDASRAAEAATLCTDCGACQRHCYLHRPLPELLREARAELLPAPAFEPLQPVQGSGSALAIEADERPMAAALERRLGVPVRRWPTSDRLGVAAVEHSAWAPHAEAIRQRCVGADVIIADGGVAQALVAAGVPFSWVQERVSGLPKGASSCRAPGDDRPAACCGAAGPLLAHHHDDAVRVAAFWMRRGGGALVADARCREHFHRCGTDVRDPLDALLEDS